MEQYQQVVQNLTKVIYGMRELYFGTLSWNFILLLTLYSYCGDKNKIRTSLKSLVSKNAKTWRF